MFFQDDPNYVGYSSWRGRSSVISCQSTLPAETQEGAISLSRATRGRRGFPPGSKIAAAVDTSRLIGRCQGRCSS